MKAEVVKSLAGSYLRHVERCWLVQTDWKMSEHRRNRRLSDEELDERFRKMKRRFDRPGYMFRPAICAGPAIGAAQFLEQDGIDVMGIDPQGGVHAMAVAFHEAGMLHGNGKKDIDTVYRVLKNLLRTVLVLHACHPPETRLHVYFLSPNVGSSVQELLKRPFANLQKAYRAVEWRFLIDDDFTERVVKPVLKNAGDVSGSSEFFVCSVRLLEAAGYRLKPPAPPEEFPARSDRAADAGGIQPLVRALMRTLLVGRASLLDESEKHDLTDNEYCKTRIGLRICNIALLRRSESGREIKGYGRYWKDRYGGFYVCSQWPKLRHRANAESLLAFVEGLLERKPEHGAALGPHVKAFRDYLSA